MEYSKTFALFFKIGLFTLGGGYAMIPLIQREVVDNRHWLGKEEFLDILAVAQSSPGVFAVNISIFIGNKLGGFKGSLCCALGTVLPSVLCILIIVLFFRQFKDYTVVENVFKGIRPAVVALIAVPVFSMARAAKLTWYTVWIPVVAALLIWLLDVSPIYVILVAVVAGIIWGRIKGKGGKS